MAMHGHVYVFMCSRSGNQPYCCQVIALMTEADIVGLNIPFLALKIRQLMSLTSRIRAFKFESRSTGKEPGEDGEKNVTFRSSVYGSKCFKCREQCVENAERF